MPPSRTEPVSRGLNGSATSYCLSSPVPQQDTYSQRSSTDRSMSEISGGTAPNGFSAGGRSSGSAGSAGMVMTLRTAQRSPSRCHSHTDPDRSSTLMTTPDEAPGLGRVVRRAHLEDHLVLVAQVDPLGELALGHATRSSGGGRTGGPAGPRDSRPFSTMDGVAHSEVMTVSWLRCHQPS